MLEPDSTIDDSISGHSLSKRLELIDRCFVRS